MSPSRYISPWVQEDLKKKMVFIAGPRQVGKTTLALHILKGDYTHSAYFNWDNDNDKRKILKSELPLKQRIIVLDEIHKYLRWRNWLKGHYDKRGPGFTFLVTGSARLDYYRRGGDSLQGRYHFYRLHPFSLGELNRKEDEIIYPVGKNLEENVSAAKASKSDLKSLLQLGGFPEPFFSQSEREARRWRMEYVSRVIREDMRDLERVLDFALLELLLERLPECVGSPLSINALREDLQLSHKTVSRWLKIIENLYLGFRIYPYGSAKIRAVKKEAKFYFWDWARIQNESKRFENMVACHLLKFCHYIEDTQGYRMELRYLRDTDKREVDFIVIYENKPWFAVEVKIQEEGISPSLKYFSERISLSYWYQVMFHSEKDYISGKHFPPIRVLPALRFLSYLP